MYIDISDTLKRNSLLSDHWATYTRRHLDKEHVDTFYRGLEQIQQTDRWKEHTRKIEDHRAYTERLDRDFQAMTEKNQQWYDRQERLEQERGRLWGLERDRERYAVREAKRSKILEAFNEKVDDLKRHPNALHDPKADLSQRQRDEFQRHLDDIRQTEKWRDHTRRIDEQREHTEKLIRESRELDDKQWRERQDRIREEQKKLEQAEADRERYFMSEAKKRGVPLEEVEKESVRDYINDLERNAVLDGERAQQEREAQAEGRSETQKPAEERDQRNSLPDFTTTTREPKPLPQREEKTQEQIAQEQEQERQKMKTMSRAYS